MGNNSPHTIKPEDAIHYSATCSPCGQYRYVLRRRWAEQQVPCIFVMLNPSTADAQKDDPTIRRVMALSKGFGFGGVYVLNLFAIRGSNPDIIKQVANPVGTDNKHWWGDTVRDLRRWYGVLPTVICAWGTRGGFRDQDRVALGWLAESGVEERFCLGRTKDGFPKHPLYLPQTVEMECYRT